MADDAPEASRDGGIELVLEYLKHARAFDFTGYKRTTVVRRVQKRMQAVGIGSYEEYVDHLQVEAPEFAQLFNTILINVTSFFRDPDAWQAVRERVVPDLLGRKPDGPLRVWSADARSGEEAYSAVMVLADAIGADGVKDRLKVYATDVDADALDHGRQAIYRSGELDSVPADLRERYFELNSVGGVFRRDLRRVVIFGQHDLLQDAPISRVDLLLCRNTLMYFNTEVQSELLHRLHFSLAEGGHLMLGKVEMFRGQSELFAPVDVKQRLFRKISTPTPRTRLLVMAGGRLPLGGSNDRLAEVAFEQAADAAILLDGQGTLLAANAEARNRFGILPESTGRPFQDLELSYRPVELRSCVDQARADDRRVEMKEVARFNAAGELSFLDICVIPLAAGGVHLGALISFTDVSRHRELREELEQTHRELETAYEELQAANEELETTNEELQSTIEELETTNEELQSTNEELETTNEELSSTNEELQALNDELRDRTTELNQANAYVESILTSIQASVIVLDRDLQVRIWNGVSYEMWGLRADEVERRGFLGLDIGFPAEALTGPVRACLAGKAPPEPTIVDAVNRRGQPVRCRAWVAPLSGVEGVVEGVILLIEEEQAS